MGVRQTFENAIFSLGNLTLAKEAQMEALQSVTSCLSPGGCNFHYTKEYLKNPYTFWAVIKDGDKIVGRATVFIGENRDNSGTYSIARVSKIYSIAPISEESVDNTLQKYANEAGYNFITSGNIRVPGLTKVYDDHVTGTEEEGVVEIL